MAPFDADANFAGSVPQLYDRYLVPLIFESCAQDLAGRVAARRPARVLEVAAGTGVATRALARALPAGARIVATDLNQAMLDHAIAVGTARPVEWRQADAMRLPFEDEAFDAVACQFGVMFFAGKPQAFAEIRRVLKPGGLFAFNVWDRISENDFAQVVTEALEGLFPDDPPRFLARTPHGYHDTRGIEGDLAQAGFAARPRIDSLDSRSRAETCEIPAVAYCQGTPLRNEIVARDATGLPEATHVAAQAIARRFGRGPVDGRIRAHVVTVER